MNYNKYEAFMRTLILIVASCAFFFLAFTLYLKTTISLNALGVLLGTIGTLGIFTLITYFSFQYGYKKTNLVFQIVSLTLIYTILYAMSEQYSLVPPLCALIISYSLACTLWSFNIVKQKNIFLAYTHCLTTILLPCIYYATITAYPLFINVCIATFLIQYIMHFYYRYYGLTWLSLCVAAYCFIYYPTWPHVISFFCMWLIGAHAPPCIVLYKYTKVSLWHAVALCLTTSISSIIYLLTYFLAHYEIYYVLSFLCIFTGLTLAYIAYSIKIWLSFLYNPLMYTMQFLSLILIISFGYALENAFLAPACSLASLLALFYAYYKPHKLLYMSSLTLLFLIPWILLAYGIATSFDFISLSITTISLALTLTMCIMLATYYLCICFTHSAQWILYIKHTIIFVALYLYIYWLHCLGFSLESLSVFLVISSIILALLSEYTHSFILRFYAYIFVFQALTYATIIYLVYNAINPYWITRLTITLGIFIVIFLAWYMYSIFSRTINIREKKTIITVLKILLTIFIIAWLQILCIALFDKPDTSGLFFAQRLLGYIPQNKPLERTTITRISLIVLYAISSVILTLIGLLYKDLVLRSIGLAITLYVFIYLIVTAFNAPLLVNSIGLLIIIFLCSTIASLYIFEQKYISKKSNGSSKPHI